MIDAPEIPVEVVPGEILPAPKKRGPKPKAQRTAGVKHRRVAWLRTARVIDLEAFKRLRATGVGAKKLSKALAIPQSSAQTLIAGLHWQQNPVKVAEFNRFHKASLDPVTGFPTADDLAKHGGKYALATRHDSDGEKALRGIVEDAGVAPGQVGEAVRRMQMLAGEDVGIPDAPDTKYFQDEIDKKLALALACMDQVTLAGASAADLTRFISMSIEKRALLRGEPTSIVRNEQRGGLDKLAALLLDEVKRRGFDLDMPKTAYREVTG